MSSPLKLLSPQAKAVYKLLSKRSPLTAREIGDSLGILPNAVYRANKQLLELSVIEKSNSYPVTYSRVPLPSAMGWFLLSAQRSFRETFSTNDDLQALIKVTNAPSMSFVKTRANLLSKTDKDAVLAKREINFIVSGLEVPDSTVLAYRKATTKGVRVRALIQKRNETSKEKLEQWHDLGVEFRYIDDLGIRMFVFDNKIVYLTSYSQDKKQEAFGVRFAYVPFAVMMNGLFEQKWEAAERFR